MTPLVVTGVIVVVTILILLFDVALYSDSVDRNSISQVIIDLSKRSPFVPYIIGFFMGLLAGHLFG